MKKVLCGVLLLALLACFAPAAGADTDLWFHHRSEAWLVHDEPAYETSGFTGVFLGLETVGNADTEPQERELIIAGGKYSYRGHDGELMDVDNTATGAQRAFGLRWVEEDREYVPINEDGEDLGGFQREANTGLSGVGVYWTGYPEGNRTLPNFIGTDEQLRTGVPYVRLERNENGHVTGFTVSMGEAQAPATPLPVNVKFQVRFSRNGRWVKHEWKDPDDPQSPLWKTYTGTPLTGSLAEPIAPWDFCGVQLRVKRNGVQYRWTFFQANETKLNLSTQHISRADLVNDEPDYNTTRFDSINMNLYNEDVAANRLHMEARGTLTVNGSFTYYPPEGGEKEVENGKVDLPLMPDMGEGQTLEYNPRTAFAGRGADSGGMNRQTVSWTFKDDWANLASGDAQLPDFVSTRDQLSSRGAPYIKLERDANKAITGFTVSMVTASNPAVPVTVPVDGARLRVRFRQGGEWVQHYWTDPDTNEKQKDKDYKDGEPLHDMLTTPIPAEEFNGVMVRVTKRGEPGQYRWLFSPADEGEVDFYSQHRSEAWLVGDKSDYSHAEFAGVYLGFEPKEGTEIKDPKPRELTLTGGAYSYRYHGEWTEVDNTQSKADQKFALRWVDEDREYVVCYKEDGESFAFRGKADTGLNGVPLSWTGNPAGSATLPNYVSTKAQLESGAPYVTLTREEGQITGFTVSLVNASDPAKQPVAVDGARIRVGFCQGGNWSRREWTGEESVWKNYEGQELSDTLESPIPVKDFGGVDVRVRKDGATYRWRFFPAEKTSLEFWAQHRSEACLIGDAPDYSTAEFNRVLMGLESSVTASKLHMDARGTLTVKGSFSYNSEKDGTKTVTDGSANFDLVPVMAEGEELSYELPGNVEAFKGAADTGGLNGQKVSWTFGGAANLQDGEATLPNFISTADQLKNGVPYITLKRDSSNAVTGFTVSLVKASDPTTPVAVENTRLQVRVGQNGTWKQRTWTDTNEKWKDYTGSVLSNTLATPIPAGEFSGVDVRVRINGAMHCWQFLPATVTDEGISYTPPSGKSIASGAGKNTITLAVDETIGVKSRYDIYGCFFDQAAQVIRIENSKDGSSWAIIAHQIGTVTIRILSTHSDESAGQVYFISKPLEITVTAQAQPSEPEPDTPTSDKGTGEMEKTQAEKAEEATQKMNEQTASKVEELKKAPENKKALEEVGAILNDSLKPEEIAEVTPEEFESAVNNKKDEEAAKEAEKSGEVADAKVPAGTDLLKDYSSNEALQEANDKLSVQPKVVEPVAVSETSKDQIATTLGELKETEVAEGVDFSTVQAAAENLQTDIQIDSAEKSVTGQTVAVEELFNKVSGDLADANGGNGVVIATVFPRMRPNVTGFFPLKVNLRHLTPGRRLRFWPSVSHFQNTVSGKAVVADVSLAAAAQEGSFFFLDSAGNPVSTVRGNAADMTVVPYLEKDGDYSTAFITVDANEAGSDLKALKDLAEAAKSGGEDEKTDTDNPTSDKSSGGCDMGLGGIALLMAASLLLTKKR